MPHLVLVIVGLAMACAVAAADESLGVVPVPKQVKDYGRTLPLSAGKLAIIIGDEATEPEQYAAERLQGLVEKRFGLSIPVHAASAQPAGVEQVILLGQISTNARFRELPELRDLGLAEPPPGLDAYALDVFEDEGVIAVCGANERGVIYGAQTLFKLMRKGEESPVVPVVSIRDWPSIPWRGRPHSRIQTHLAPGALDAYLWAGLNFTDVRAVAFGYGPEAQLDREEIGQAIREAHRRGLFVYGTVSCGIRPAQFDGALRVFSELIDLGVDGLWISFDDPGGGEGTAELVRRVIELSKQKGITGRAIATTPATGSYQQIDTEFNRGIVKVAGMEEATWFFTRVPCREDFEATRKLGLNSFPAWWHNWPRTDAGFTHGSYGGGSFRADGKASYMEIPPLTWGWHRPNYDKIRDAPQHTDTAMLWGGWQHEYTPAVLGLWAWEPAKHDFAQTRRAIYETVFGGPNVDRMVRFDDALHELKGHFILPDRRPDPVKNFPPRLKPGADRENVDALIAELEGLLAAVEPVALQETLLERERLRAAFLEPMRAELATGKALAGLARPEDWWPEHEAAALAKLAAGDRAEVEALSAGVRPRLEAELGAIATALAGLQGMDAYAKLWRDRAVGGVEYWEGELKRRAEAFEKRIDARKKDLDLEGMLANIDRPPEGGELLATVAPRQLATSVVTHHGAWATGPYPREEPVAFVMSFPGRTGSTPGDFCQVEFAVEAPKFEGALHLQLHLTDEYDSDQWTKYRFYQLLHEGEVVWEEDIALTRRGGKEWSEVDVTELARGKEKLELTLRLLDKRPVGNYPTTIFVGPVRLIGRQ